MFKSSLQIQNKKQISEKQISLEETSEESTVNLIKSILLGYRASVKQLGFITGENPMGKKENNVCNEKANAELVFFLSYNHYKYKEVKGKYENAEKSFLVPNITLTSLKEIGIKFKQVSFIFAVIEKVGKSVFYYYEIPESKRENKDLKVCDYELKSTRYIYTENQSTVSIYNEYKGIKFNIPFLDNTGETAKFTEFYLVDEDGYKIYYDQNSGEIGKISKDLEARIIWSINEKTGSYSKYKTRFAIKLIHDYFNE